ncbi:MAG: M15 family metallopeptidase [Asticcacaulis sp.]|nr:M15 family metallopeptidase [Asticcacaulis sp.]
MPPIVYQTAARVLAVATLFGALGCSLRQAGPLDLSAPAKAVAVAKPAAKPKSKPKPVTGPVVDCRTAAGTPGVTVKGVGHASHGWEASNLVMVNLPWRAHAAWDPRIAIPAVQVNRNAAPSLVRALNTIWLQAGQNQAEIDRLGLSAIGGGYNYRPMRDGERLSAHAYGCAVDFDPDRNAMGDKSPNFAQAENRYVIDAFRGEGWSWGGVWGRPDGMDFQAGRVMA